MFSLCIPVTYNEVGQHLQWWRVDMPGSLATGFFFYKLDLIFANKVTKYDTFDKLSRYYVLKIILTNSLL